MNLKQLKITIYFFNFVRFFLYFSLNSDDISFFYFIHLIKNEETQLETIRNIQ